MSLVAIQTDDETERKERQAEHCRNYARKNRELINQRKRASYHANREAILAKRKEKIAHCPLCGFDFCNVTYLKEHLINRHKLSPEEAVRVIAG